MMSLGLVIESCMGSTLRVSGQQEDTGERIVYFDEIELSFSVEDACKEARRCLRCDLEFTQPKEDEAASPVAVGGTV